MDLLFKSVNMEGKTHMRSFNANAVAKEIVLILARNEIPINLLDIVFEAVREEISRQAIGYPQPCQNEPR